MVIRALGDDDGQDELNQAILASDSQDSQASDSDSFSSAKLHHSVIVITETVDESESADENNILNEKITPLKTCYKKFPGWRSVASTTKKKKVWTQLCYISSDDESSDNRPKPRKKEFFFSEATSDKTNTITDSEDDDFENFLTKFKTPKRHSKSPRPGLHDGSFIVNTSDEENDGPEFHLALRDTPFKKRDDKITKQISNLTSPSKLASITGKKGFMTEPRRKFTNISKEKRDLACQPRLSFLSSLDSNADINKCDPDAIIYRNSFKNHKDVLANKLFTLFNNKIFEDQLSHDMEINWNTRMTQTAGFCRCKKDRQTGIRSAKIELAPKVVDNADRLRDTLIHELCHAAVWVINGIHNGHGKIWKNWTRKASCAFPELPPIGVCHSYAIHTKFTYKCTRAECTYKIGRHSKSIDTTKKCCPYCSSKLELLKNTKTRNVEDVKNNSKKKNNNEEVDGITILNSYFANKLSLMNYLTYYLLSIERI
uniref:SprT-like domain-containing protein n=1 Tax=Strigamia maritima TaxID=126957 RepID=T1J8F3_STRMM